MKAFPKLGSKRMLFWVLVFIIFSISTYFFGEYKVFHSEPYLIMQRFLMENREVSLSLGVPQKLSLKAYKMNTLGEEGNARFDIGVLGKKDNGKATVELQEKAGIWHITYGSLLLRNGSSIPLTLGNQ